MGITGLLPLLNNAKKPVHIREYFGKVVAIDGHCWLHQGAISCAMDLALGRSTTKYITYFMHRIELLRFHNVIPYVVFDGQPLPIKAATNAIRAVKRQEGRNKALDLLKSGNNKEAYKYFQQSISITVEMIQGVIHELDKINVKHIVAPYEADSQLTFLIQNHIVDAIITEDSDMIPFGCSDVIYKMNKFGDGILIKMDAIMQSNIFRDFNMVKLKWMCILSGCDYLPSVPGVGLKKAQNMIDKYTCIEKIMDSLTLKDDDYVKNFNRALDAFLYQFVYDPHKKEYVRLNSLPVGEEDRDLSYLGDQPDDHTNEILKTNHTTRIVKEVFKYCENNKENIQPVSNETSKPFIKKQSSISSFFKIKPKCQVVNENSPVDAKHTPMTAGDRPVQKEDISTQKTAYNFKEMHPSKLRTDKCMESRSQVQCSGPFSDKSNQIQSSVFSFHHKPILKQTVINSNSYHAHTINENVNSKSSNANSHDENNPHTSRFFHYSHIESRKRKCPDNAIEPLHSKRAALSDIFNKARNSLSNTGLTSRINIKKN